MAPRAADGSEMRLSRLIALVSVVFVLLGSSLPAQAASDDPWVFEGGGWGHGVGLSQFGALGQAQEGKNAAQILAFYYKGSSVAIMPSDHWTRQENGLWVGLVSDTTTVDLMAVGGSVTVCHPTPTCAELNQVLNPGEDWRFEINLKIPDQCRLRHVGVDNTGWGSCHGVVTGLSPSARLDLNGRQYARGTVRFDPSPSGFHAVATLKLEEYLYGLAEVPSSWPSEALKAQAIIGRSFAVATAVERGGDNGAERLSSCGCHLRSTPADQAYAGWSKEDPTPSNFGAQWKAAVDNTNRSILTHPKSNYAMDIAKAFYSSSNGGASENVEDVWGGTALPWLRSVNDPYSSNPNINPLATWSVKVSNASMAAYFGWDRATDAVITRGPPGVLVKFIGMKNGTEVASEPLSGWEIVSLLKAYGFDYHAPGSPNSDPDRPRVSPYISGVSDPAGFDDIVGNIFEADIEWAAEVGITKGCNPPANTRFCPDDPVSREVMAAFIDRYLDLPAASKDYFNDDNNSIFEDHINRMAEAGITKGCGPGKFCPGETVDRGQMAAFLVRAFGLTDDGGGDRFVDDDHSMFEHDIDKLATAGITKGCNPPTNNRYCPELAVDRAAMTAFLHRSPGP
ncbi:MAG: SpoIID/LytB domain-containing protein [Acidimicrobiia bacterium]